MLFLELENERDRRGGERGGGKGRGGEAREGEREGQIEIQRERLLK